MRQPIIAITATGLLWCVGCGGGDGEIPLSAALIVEAQEAMDAGETTKAVEALDASIAAEPTIWAYAIRARIHAETGNDQAAEADCLAGLAMDETNEELAWVKRELKKPKDKRFKEEVASSRK